jgi:hypothetical protein
MTRTGTVMGTPFYMSPEQVRGEKVDARSDVFSVGSVFYELLTDHKPFVAESMHAVLFQVLQNQPEPVRKWAPTVPQVLVEVVERCLVKDSAQRFADGGELRAALAAAHRAIEEGRGDSTHLADELALAAQATVVERPKVSRSGRSPGSSHPSLAVAGATALDKASTEGLSPTARPAGTLRSATTRAGVSRTGRTVAPGPRPTSQTNPLMFVGVGAIVVALGAAGYFLFKPGPPPPPTPAPSGAGDLTQSLVATQLALARRQLDDKDWPSAVGQAEEVLKLDPSNVEAQRIRDTARKTLAEVEKTAGDARTAFDAGRVEEASSALSRLLALNPTHPVAAELSGKLNSRFRGEAEGARQQMRGALNDAQRAGAGGGAAFAEAMALAREAESFFGKGAFASAARQFMASRNAFDRARREAANRPTPPPTATPTAVAVATPVPTPLPTPPPTPVPTPTPPPPTAAPTPVNEEPAIRKLVADLGHAIEQKDLALYKRLRPNLSSEDERRLRAAFDSGQSQQVSLSIVSIQISGSEARVRVSRRDTFKGRAMDLGQQTWVLVKSGGGWTVREIGQ